MKKMGTVLLAAATWAISGSSFAGPPPPPPPLPTIDEVNVMILIDVSGSMADLHASGKTKLAMALQNAANYIKAREDAYNTAGDHFHKPIDYALWAFDSSFSGSNYVSHIVDFPGTATAVLTQLGYNSSYVETPATRNAVLTPTSSTPLAGAGCAAAGTLVADLTPTGGLISGGYEWNKEKSPGLRASIERRLYVGTDGLENDTPDTNECGGTTSSGDYTAFEDGSWQAHLRNKLLTGSATRTNTLNSGLVVDVDMFFHDYVNGISKTSKESHAFSKSGNYSSQPTLAQALEFYGGLSDNTHGKFRTVTVAADGTVDTRRPGDVDYSGCVGNADYSEMMQVYGQQVNTYTPLTYHADLNGDGWVDYLDYLILSEHWGEGGTC